MQYSRVVIVGYGSIGQGLTPLLFKHFPYLQPNQVMVVTGDARGESIANEYGIKFEVNPLTPGNYRDVLHGCFCTNTVATNISGDLLINVSVNVSSVDLIKWCQANGVRYIDTCVEPWAGGYDNKNVEETTNCWLREQALSLRGGNKPTAVIAHGANPGLVTHLVKCGLVELAERRGLTTRHTSWADLSNALGVKVIQIAERDSQVCSGLTFDDTKFYNTWSVDGLISEAQQRSEMGWGTHEPQMPERGRKYSFGNNVGIYLDRRSVNTKVKSWVPSVGEQDAFMITHHEALSIASLLTTNSGELYRPTVYYAYHPCDLTVSSLNHMIATGVDCEPKNKLVLNKEITSGSDELGVLFVFDGGAFWYGSTLSVERARVLAPHNTATSLQVTSTIVSAIHWMETNNQAGVVEAEDICHQEIMKLALPYLGDVQGVMTDWQPGFTLDFNSFVSDTSK